jgi:hypothetical protein
VVGADLPWWPWSGVGSPVPLLEIPSDRSHHAVRHSRLTRPRRVVAGVKDGKDEPATGTQNTRDAAQGRSEIRYVHQRHVTENAIEGGVCNAVEVPRIGVEVLNATRLANLVTPGDGQQLGRGIDADHRGTLICQIPRDSPLTTGKVTDALAGNLAHESLDGWKVRILPHQMHPDPLVVPLGDIVIGTQACHLSRWRCRQCRVDNSRAPTLSLRCLDAALVTSDPGAPPRSSRPFVLARVASARMPGARLPLTHFPIIDLVMVGMDARARHHQIEGVCSRGADDLFAVESDDGTIDDPSPLSRTLPPALISRQRGLHEGGIECPDECLHLVRGDGMHLDRHAITPSQHTRADRSTSPATVSGDTPAVTPATTVKDYRTFADRQPHVASEPPTSRTRLRATRVHLEERNGQRVATCSDGPGDDEPDGC